METGNVFKKTFLEIENYFAYPIYSCEVGLMKPHADIFELACRKLYVKPQDSLMIGDSLNLDVRGAINYGMKGVWLNRKDWDLPDDLSFKPDGIINSLGELIPLLEDNI